MNTFLLSFKRGVIAKIFILAFFIISNLPAQISWQQTSLFNQLQGLGTSEAPFVLSVAVNSSGYIFTGTNGDGSFLSTDNGVSWSQINNSLSNDLVRTWVVNSAGNIFAGTYGSGVFLSTNNGTSWSQVNNGLGNNDVFALTINSAGYIFAGTDSEGVYLSTNNGASWTQINNGLTNLSLRQIAINSSGYIFAATWGGGVYLSTNNGASWTPVNNGLTNADVQSLAINSSGYIFAGTYGSGVFLSTNNGTSWTQINSGLPNITEIYAIVINSSGSIFAATGYYTNGLYLSTNNGASWSLTGLSNYNVSALAINSSGYVIAGTYGAGDYITSGPTTAQTAITNSAAGITSTTATLNGTVNPNGISATVQFDYGTTTSYGTTVTASQSPVTGSSNVNVSANLTGLTPNTLYHFRCWATNAAGTTYGADSTFTTLNNGAAQDSVSLPTFTRVQGAPPEWIDVAVSNLTGQNVSAFQFTLTYNKSVIFIDSAIAGPVASGGSLVFNADTANQQIKVAFASANAISGSGTLVQLKVHYINAGTSSLAFNGTFEFNQGTPAAIITEGSIITTPSAITWIQTSLYTYLPGFGTGTAYVNTLAINSSGYVFAGTSGDGVFLSTNNGTTWTAVNTGLTNSAVRALAINSSGYIFAGTDTGVFLSTNNGVSWASASSGLGSNAVYALAVNSSGYVFAGTYSGGVFLSTNNGTSWTAVNNGLSTSSIHSLIVNSFNYIFAGTVGGGVFLSTNEGTSWTQVNNGLTNNTIWSLAVNSSGYVFAGTYDGGVFFSTNSGTSWTSQNTGLPGNPDVYSLAINAADYIFAGMAYVNLGAYISTNSSTSWSLSGLANNNVAALCVSPSGYVFAGTFEGGVYRTGSPTSINTIPASPILAAPSNGSTGISVSPILSWNVSIGAASYRLQVSADSTFKTTTFDTTGVTATSAAISGLSYQLKYFWRVNATDSYGTSAWSNIWSFTTIFNPNPAVVTTYPATSVGQTTATLNGAVNPNGLSTTVQFDYGTTISYGTTVAAIQSPVTGSTTISDSVSLTGLTLNTLYHFRIRATNTNGISYGADSTFTTLAPVPIVITNTTTNITQTTATLNGIVNANGLSTAVQFDYGTTTSYGTSIRTAQTTITGVSNVNVNANISGLTLNTLYHFRCEATNSAGTTYGPDSTFTTLLYAQTWQPTNGPNVQQIFSIAINSSSYVFAGTNSGVYLSTDNGTSWTQEGLTSNNIRSLAINSTGYIFAGTDAGVYLSTNNGSSWTPVNSSMTTTSVYSLAINSSGYIFAGTNTGVFFSTNSGTSWTQENSGLGGNGVNALVVNSSGYIFASNTAGIYLSTNNGSTWTQVNNGLTYTSVQSLVINSAGYIFAGTAAGGVFLSTNNGSSWSAANTGITGSDVLSLAVNSSGYIFAGTNSGAYISVNNGTTWTPSGLPYYEILSLAINSSGYAFAGTYGYGVYRTGSPTITQVAITNSAANITSTSATLYGLVNPDGISSSVQFDYGTTTSYGTTVTAAQSPVTGSSNVNVSANVSSLTPYTLYHFRVKITNSGGTKYGYDMTFTTNYSYPSTISLSQSYTFSDPTLSSSYKLIGLPGNLSASFTQFISGTPKQDWDAYYDNGNTNNYLNEYDGTSTFTFKPGNGFWLISKNEISISQTVNTVTLNSDNTYSIALNNGWNIISNPFGNSVMWDSVIIENSLSSNSIIFSWNAAWSETGTFAPYTGYYFYNQENLTLLKIPYNPGSALGKTLSKATAFNANDGTSSLRLSLNSGDTEKSFVIISIDSTSSNDYNSHDILAPPGDFEDAGMAIHNDKLSIAYKYLLKESRPPAGNGQAFNINITDKRKEQLTLKSEGVNNFKGSEVYLADTYNAKLYNMKENNSIVLNPLQQAEYQILIGSTAFIKAEEAAILPADYKLYQNYPNPFNPNTTIEYSIPKTTNVTLKVYNILGKEVAVLVNGLQTAGNYRVEFSANSGYASGVYFYRIQAGSFVQTKKLLLLK